MSGRHPLNSVRYSKNVFDTGLLTDTLSCGLRMRREWRERFSPPRASKQTASYRSRHASRHGRHARAVMHVGIANPQWRGKRSRHSRRMCSPQFYVSGERPIGRLHKSCLDQCWWCTACHHPRKCNGNSIKFGIWSKYRSWGGRDAYLHGCILLSFCFCKMHVILRIGESSPTRNYNHVKSGYIYFGRPSFMLQNSSILIDVAVNLAVKIEYATWYKCFICTSVCNVADCCVVYLASLPPCYVVVMFKVSYPNTCYRLRSWALFVKLLSDKCRRTCLMISQHWFT